MSDAAEEVAELRAELARTLDQNRRLTDTLREARDHLVALKTEVDLLAQPPGGYGQFERLYTDGTVDVFTGGRSLRLNVSPHIDPESLVPGQRVLLNEALNVIDVLTFPEAGDIVTLKEVLDDGRRALTIGHTDEVRLVMLAEPLYDVRLRPGDRLLLEPRSGYVYEVIPHTEAEPLALEEFPDVGYDEIGGLDEQLAQIRRAVELTQRHPDVCRRMGLRPPKGILLYGPPGCGKTLIAKALAGGLARSMGAHSGPPHFLSVKGPELLNKYVGETERDIRLIFQRAREKAAGGSPVIVFFDEMESLVRTRGSGISSDVENTIVGQLLSEIDGVEGLDNVIVIGASNREDMLDPAILRPGRLDLRIRVDRPDRAAALDIFGKHLTAGLPLHPQDLAAHHGAADLAVRNMIQHAVAYLYTDNEATRFVEVTYESGQKEVLHFRDFTSGAAIKNIVDRAKSAAVERHLTGRDEPLGIRVQDVIRAAKEEIRDTAQLTNTTNPDDWSRVAGARGENIVFVRTLGRAARRFSHRELSNYGL